MRLTRTLRWLAVLCLAALVAAGCGSDDDTAAPGDDTDTATDDNGDDNGDDGEGGDPEPGPGFDGSTIRVGILTPLTGGVEIIGNPLTAGHEVYWQRVNAEGGVDGRYQVELDIRDSVYAADQTVQQYNAIKNDVVMFGQILGTPPTNAVLPQLIRDNIVAAPASLDAEWVREQHLLPIGGPYQMQMINGAAYYLDEGGSADDTFCVMAADDDYGDAGIEGVEHASAELGFSVETTARYAAGDTDFTAQVGQLERSGCDVVFLVATPRESSGIWGRAIDIDFAPRWIAQSPVWINVMPALVGAENQQYLEDNVWIAAEGTDWGDESVEGMRQMIADIEQYQPDQQPDYYFAFGYNQARATHALLERAVQRGDLSRDGIVEALNSLGTVTFGDLTGDYDYGDGPDSRVFPTQSSIFEVDVEKPNSLAVVALNYSSEAAESYEV